MNTVIKISIALFSSLLMTFTSASDYELIAENNSIETQMCIKAAIGPKFEVKKYYNNSAWMTKRKFERSIECNSMSLFTFVGKFGSNEMKKYFNVPATKVEIRDVAYNSGTTILVAGNR